MHDFLALLAGDLGPIIWIGRVGQILVFLELLADRADEVVGSETAALLGNGSLDGILLGTRDDAFDQCAARKIFKVENFLFSVRIGHFNESVLFGGGVHGADREVGQMLVENLAASA